MEATERLHYMDNLRALTMLAGVFFHAALAYSPFLHNVWLSSDQVMHPAFDWFANFLHAFRMPLFFMIAGFFAALLAERRGMTALFKNRARRVLLPFVVFWPLITVAIVFPIGWALENVQHLSPILQFVKGMQNVPDAPQPPPSTYHLWFLYYLVIFYILLWVARTLLPTELKQKIADLPPVLAILILPLCIAPAFIFGFVPYPAPESFMPQIWALIFFGGFFAYGYVLFFSAKHIQYFANAAGWLILASVLLFIPFQYFYPAAASFEPANPPWFNRIVMVLCLVYIAVFMSVASLVLAKKYLSGQNKVMRFFADASYWIYLAHLPVLLLIQYYLLDVSGSAFYEFTLSSLLTLIFCVATYVVFVRWTPIGWMLNGRKNSKPEVPHSASAIQAG